MAQIMKKGFSHLVFVCAVGILIGCYNPQRDLSIDPYNTPLIHILDATYEANTGMVVVQWEYLGQKRVENFVLERRDNISVFRNVKRSSGADVNGKYATVGTFRDDALIAGERVQYRVTAEHSAGGLVRTPAAEIPIPGAGLREVRRDPIALAVQLVWQVEIGEVVTYEVVRAPGKWQLRDDLRYERPSIRHSFWDRSVADNHPYTYAIRSRLSTGSATHKSQCECAILSRGGAAHRREPERCGRADATFGCRSRWRSRYAGTNCSP